jgi:hypothetical protein
LSVIIYRHKSITFSPSETVFLSLFKLNNPGNSKILFPFFFPLPSYCPNKTTHP